MAVNSQLITDRYANILADTNCAIPANSLDPTSACTLGQEKLAALLANPEYDDETKALFKEIYGPSINEAFIPKNPFITAEVDDAFEVPLAFLMDQKNVQRHSRDWQGMTRHYYAITFSERYIWGVTAGILRNLHERIYQ